MILYLCMDVSYVKKQIQKFVIVRLIFTKSCIPILLLNNKNAFLPLFCQLSVKIEAFKHMWRNTARFLCFIKKLFFVFEKLFVSMAWNFGNKFGQLNKWYKPHRLYWISWKIHFLFYEKKNPSLKSSLFWSGYLNILISYSKSRYQYQNKNTFFTWTLKPW